MPIIDFLRFIAQKLLQCNAKGINIRARIRLCKAILLRRRISPRSQKSCVLFQVILRLPRRIEIYQAYMAIFSQDDIGRLYIPVDNILFMEEVQNGTQFPGSAKQLLFSQFRFP